MYHNDMALITTIRELGNQLQLTSDDGQSWTFVPSMGGLWTPASPITVADAPPEPEPEPGPGPTPPPTTPPPTPGTPGEWQWPFQYSKFVIQNYKPAQYGMRVNPVTGVYRLHAGLDFGAGGISGRDIPAACAGTVTLAKSNGGEGNAVHIQHSGGFVTKYFHMVTGSFRVKTGDTVTKGQILGKVGSTGNSTGAHLHWETWSGGKSENPRDFMKARGVPES